MNNEERWSFIVSAKEAQQSFLQYYNTLDEAWIMRKRAGKTVRQLELPPVLQHIGRSMTNEEEWRSFRVSAKAPPPVL